MGDVLLYKHNHFFCENLNVSMAKEEFKNPIDKDKITENPHTLPYAHTVGSAVVRPLDKGKIKGLAMSAMYEQSDKSLDQIRNQVELLMEQAKDIHRRVEVSEKIYKADYNFKPNISQKYHLYEKEDNTWILSMIGPEEWGKKPCPYLFVQSVKLMSDHTWELQ